MQNEKERMSIRQNNEFGDKKLIWRQAFIGHKRHKYFFEGWNHLDLLDIIPEDSKRVIKTKIEGFRMEGNSG